MLRVKLLAHGRRSLNSVEHYHVSPNWAGPPSQQEQTHFSVWSQPRPLLFCHGCIPRPTSLGLHSPPFLFHLNFCKLTLDYGPVVLSALRVLIRLTLTR